MDLTHRFRDCSCPGTPHPKGDTVTFPERLSFDDNVAAVSAIYGGDGPPRSSKAFSVYLHAPVSWNVLDAEGDPVELTREALDALSFEDQYEIADHGDTLYAGTVLAPLVRRMSWLSSNGPTDGSSNPSKSPSSKARRPPEPSSEGSTDPSATTPSL